jgi:Guanylate kinase
LPHVSETPSDTLRRGIPFVMTGASGVGKDTIRRDAVPHLGDVVYSVSATTRGRRPGEMDGVQYHFLDEDRSAR